MQVDQQEFEQLQRDALRYRWLVNQPMPGVFHPAFAQLGSVWKTREVIAATIDAAILAAAGEAKSDG